jgi:hypothetical protein
MMRRQLRRHCPFTLPSVPSTLATRALLETRAWECERTLWTKYIIFMSNMKEARIRTPGQARERALA